MAMKGCDDLFRLLGYDCRELDGEIELTTPLTLPGGAPVRAYFRPEAGDMIAIHDGGELLLEAAGLGMLELRRFETTFQHRISEAGAAFEEGEMVVRVPANQLWQGYATFLRAAMAVTAYVEERQLLETHEDELVARIETAVRRVVPEAAVQRDVTVTGFSGIEHRFPLKVNRTLVEPLRPSGRSTGPALRRIVDVMKAGCKVAAVIDDLANPWAARRETRIISAVVKVYMLSSIEDGAGVRDLAA